MAQVEADELAAEAVGNAGDGLTNVSGADDAESPSMEFEADQAFNAEIVIAHPVVSLRDMAHQGEQQREDVLGHTMRRIGRHMHHPEAKPFRRVQVDVVETRAAQGHQLCASIFENLECFCVKPVIDKDNHCRISAS